MAWQKETSKKGARASKPRKKRPRNSSMKSQFGFHGISSPMLWSWQGVNMKWKVQSTLGRGPVCGNHISKHKMLFTSQQLRFRGVNVFLGMEPKCTYNYGLKDSMNLGHTTFNLQQNSRWRQYNLCANSTGQLSPVCALKEIIMPAHLAICQKKGGFGA